MKIAVCEFCGQPFTAARPNAGTWSDYHAGCLAADQAKQEAWIRELKQYGLTERDYWMWAEERGYDNWQKPCAWFLRQMYLERKMGNGNWFDYMPELGDPPTADLMERPGVTTLFGAPERKPVERAARALETAPEGRAEGAGARLADSPLAFILAGKAYFTLVSAKTGKRYTYRVSKAEPKEGDNRPAPWFVSLLTGPDNYANYRYIGMIGGGDKRFRTTAKSAYPETSEPVKAFAWTYGWLLKGQEPPQVEIWHNGKCGRCGRMLTVPESISNGIGPECAKKGMAA